MPYDLKQMERDILEAVHILGYLDFYALPSRDALLKHTDASKYLIKK